MNRRLLTGIVVSLTIIACMPAHAIVLTYAPRVGEVHKQKIMMSGAMETSSPMLGDAMRGQMSLDTDFTEKALSQTDTTTRMQTEIVGGKIAVSMAGQSQTMDMPTGRMVADMDRRNRVVKWVEVHMSSAPGKSMMGPGSENFTNWSQFGAFPEGDVDVNDTWSGTMSIPASEGTPAIAMDYECKLLELAEFKGHKCAKIHTSFHGPFSMDLSQTQGMPAGAEGTMEATIQGDMTWHYDYENSVYVYGEGTVGMDMKMTMSGAGMPATNMTTKMKMNLKTALQD